MTQFLFQVLVGTFALLALLLPTLGKREGRRLVASTFAVQALVVAGLLVASGGEGASWQVTASGAWSGVGLTVDALTGSMFALVALLGAALVSFSSTYLSAEKRGPGFVRLVGVTVMLVQGFVLSSHLALHALFWLAMSVTVHRLLRHYDHRPRARLSAKKKFLMSRLGDVCFLWTLGVLWYAFGTLEVQALLERAQVATPDESQAIAWASWGLVGAAMLKSAQVPFHAWLPETMEAPTPVSALMHAGVVNAGAFLLLRLSPLLVHGAGALTALVVIGAATASIGLVVQATQPSVKLALAWSTIAQMGFLFFELGLGLTAAAWIHLVAHAAYKAQAFLRSGTVQLEIRQVWAGPGTMAVRGLVSVALFLGVAVVASRALGHGSSEPVLWLAALWGLASAPLLGGLASQWRRVHRIGLGLVAFGVVASAETLFGSWFAPLPSVFQRGLATAGVALSALALLAVAGLVVPALFARAQNGSLALRRFYVHALGGFYVGPVTDRWTMAIWPEPKPEPSEVPAGSAVAAAELQLGGSS